MRLPLLLLVFAEVAFERFLTPGAVDWVGDGCKGRDGLVLARVAEELDESVRMVASNMAGCINDSEKRKDGPNQNRTIYRDYSPEKEHHDHPYCAQ